MNINMQVIGPLTAHYHYTSEADNDGFVGYSYTSEADNDIIPASGADGVYFDNRRFGFQNNRSGYRLNPHEKRRFDIRRGNISAEFEEQQFHQNIQYGADRSPISVEDDVYLLEAPFQDRVTKTYYFCGNHFGVPCAQLWNGYEEDHSLVMNMVQLGRWGNIVHCITVLQRKWRNRRWRLRVQPGVIQLAKKALMQVSSV